MKYTFDSKIRFSEVDSSGFLSLPGLVNYFQDCATFQSEYLGLGIGYLRERGQAWILSSWQIVIDRMPRLCEKVTAATWAYDFRAFFGMRNFTLTDEDDKVCAWANSAWVLFDMVRQRPVRVPEDEARAYEAEPPYPMTLASRKIRPSETQGEVLERLTVGRAYLDTNRHVNNGQYIAMAADYIPDGMPVRQLRAEYRNQARLGDVVTVRRIMQENGCCICLEQDAKHPYAVVEILSHSE